MRKFGLMVLGRRPVDRNVRVNTTTISPRSKRRSSRDIITKQIVQMAEDFDLDGIQKLADALDAC